MSEEAVLALVLLGRPEAAGAARRALSSLNGSLKLVSHERMVDAELLLSELVSNAFQHGIGGDSPIGLNVRANEQTMHVEVRNDGAEGLPDRGLEKEAGARGGFGLKIVAILAHRWGSRTEGDQTVVWFDIDRPQEPSRLLTSASQSA